MSYTKKNIVIDWDFKKPVKVGVIHPIFKIGTDDEYGTFIRECDKTELCKMIHEWIDDKNGDKIPLFSDLEFDEESTIIYIIVWKDDYSICTHSIDSLIGALHDSDSKIYSVNIQDNLL